MLYRRLLVRALVLSFIVPLFAFRLPNKIPTESLAALSTIKFPFGRDETWTVIQGYNAGTHDTYDKYSFDLVLDEGVTEGEPVYAPISGYVAWGGNNGDEQGCISQKITEEYRVMACHIEFSQSFSGYVSQGTTLGTVEPPNEWNDYTPHIHITLYYLPPGLPDYADNRDPIPFTYDYYPLDAANFPSDDIQFNQYVDVYGLCSTQNLTANVAVNWVITAEPWDGAKYTFYRGEPAHYWARLDNNTGNVASISYEWGDHGPSNTSMFNGTGTTNLLPGRNYRYADWPIIPDDAPEGYYTLRVSITHDTGTACRVNIFRVVP